MTSVPLTRRDFLSAALLLPAFARQSSTERFVSIVPLGNPGGVAPPPFGRLLGDGLDARLFTDLSRNPRSAIRTSAMTQFFVRTAAPSNLPPTDAWTLRVGGRVAAPGDISTPRSRSPRRPEQARVDGMLGQRRPDQLRPDEHGGLGRDSARGHPRSHPPFRRRVARPRLRRRRRHESLADVGRRRELDLHARAAGAGPPRGPHERRAADPRPRLPRRASSSPAGTAAAASSGSIGSSSCQTTRRRRPRCGSSRRGRISRPRS